MSHSLKVSEILDNTLNKFHDASSFKPYPLIKEAYKSGYEAALRDYAIWKDGSQTIGAMQRDIKEIIKEMNEELGTGEA